MTKRSALAFVILAALVIISAFTVGAANPSEDFTEKAEAITGEGSYAERKAALDSAMSSYAALDDSEREAVKEIYERVEGERAELLEIEKKAEAFLAKVAALADCSSIMDKVRIMEEAKDPSVYFDDQSYPGVSEAIAELDRIQAVRDKTAEFMITVDELLNERELTATVAENYTNLKAIVLRADALYSFVDSGYSGASGAINAYGSVRGELQKAEQHTDGILSLIQLIDSSSDYRSKKNLIANLERAIASEDFVAELDSAKTALAALDGLKKYFAECESLAQSYILAVDAIGAAENRFSAIASAIALRQTVDGTVNGVAAADGKMEAIREEYNAYATLINSVLLGFPVE